MSLLLSLLVFVMLSFTFGGTGPASSGASRAPQAARQGSEQTPRYAPSRRDPCSAGIPYNQRRVKRRYKPMPRGCLPVKSVQSPGRIP
jgi:hypothetical protein